MSNYDNWKTYPPDFTEIEDDYDDICTHYFIDNREKIAKKYQKKYCNFLTVREIIKYKYNELVRFFNREY